MNLRWLPHWHAALAWLAVGWVALGVAGCVTQSERPARHEEQVLFVCQHGNVKSLMAALYFNEAAQERGLHVHAISRASGLDSHTVALAIAEELRRDGFDVSTFEPRAVAGSDVVASRRVVLINTDLPVGVRSGTVLPERWNDVPAASVDFPAASDALQRHVRELVEELDRRENHARGPRATKGGERPSH